MKARSTQSPCSAAKSVAEPVVVERRDPFMVPYFDCPLAASAPVLTVMHAPKPPKVTIFSAPAGFGKTAAMVQLYECWSQRGYDTIWVSASGASQPAALVEQAIWRRASLTRAAKRDRRAPPARDPGASLDDVLLRLHAPVLFLDDLQDCPDTEAARLLNEMVFGTGALLRVVVASRRQVPLDHGRAALQLRCVRLGPGELAMDAAAAQLVLAGAQPPLEPETQTAMLKACEGWPAGLRLMHAAITREQSLSTQLGRFARGDASLAEFFRTHVLNAMPQTRLEFLLQLSLLNDITPELAEIATQRSDSGACLDGLVAAGAFITLLDGEPQRYRLHGLFKAFLAAEAKRRLPGEQRQALLERAATQCLQQSKFSDAIDYALQAPAPVLVHDILEASARRVVSERGDLLTFIDWVAKATALGVEIGLEAEFWHVWALAFSRRCPRARQRAQRFEQRLAALPPTDPAVHELKRRAALLRIMLHVVNDELADAKRAADERLQSDPNRSPTHAATAALAAATAVLPMQNYQEARRYVQMAQVGLHHARGAHLPGWLAATKALVELDLGFPATALGLLETATGDDTCHVAPDSPMAATLSALRARALLDLGRSDEARDILLRVLGRCAHHGFPDTTRHALEAAVALGDGGESGPLGFAELDRIASDGSPRLQRMLAASQVRRLSVMSDVARAVDIARQHGFDGEAPHAAWLPGETLAITLARIDLLIAEGMARPALKLAETALRQTISLGLRRETVELRLSTARAHMLANDRSAAVRAIARAIGLAASRSLVQPFLAQQQVFCDALRSAKLKDLALTVSEQINFAQTLCETTGATIGGAFGTEVVALGEVDALTRRELEVLALLESGPSNEQVAEQLLLSLQTVKWHLYNLYAKLGVKNRGAALAKARALKLLPGPLMSLRA